jgi:hypothetical protein
VVEKLKLNPSPFNS